MTLQAIKGGPWFPARIITDGANPLLQLTLDTASEVAGFVFLAPRTGNIDRVIYSLVAVSVTSGPLNFDARLETLGATGLNSGTLFDTNTNGADSISTTDDNTQREITLTAAAAVTRGEPLCFVLQAPGSGTFSVQLQTVGGDFTGKFPYAFNITSKTIRQPVFGLRYDDGTYVAPAECFPCLTISSSNINSSDTPDEIGNRFSLPFPCKVNAINMHLDPNASSEFTVRIYNASDTVLLEQTFDSDNHVDYGDGSMSFDLDEELELSANTTYRVTIRPAASDHELYYFTVGSASYMDMFDGGQSIYATERTDDGAWTDTTTRRYFISLRMSALDDGAGGSGSGSPNGGGAALTFAPFG